MFTERLAQLTSEHLRYVVTRTPRDIRDLLTEFHGKLYIGGGFIRETLSGSPPQDIDLFVDTAETASAVEAVLVAKRPGTKVHRSKNAITLVSDNRLPVQIITRWLFDGPSNLVRSFDFTVCQSAVWREGKSSNSRWRSSCSARFYQDLATRSLVYTNPKREEEAGGSFLRVLKFLKRGYNVQVGTLTDVIVRLTDASDEECERSGIPRAASVYSLLREVDPLLVVDGEFVDDHAPEFDTEEGR